MSTLPFAALLRDESIRERDAFLARYPHAALVVEETGSRPPCELDGRTPFVFPEWWRPTPSPQAGTSVLHPLYRYGSVVFLEKSRRNPFESLITIGRAPNNDIRYPLESLSKLHATFARSGSRWHLQDHASTSGTLVNEERLEPGRLRPLEDGDQIRFSPELKVRFFTAGGLFDFISIVARMAR